MSDYLANREWFVASVSHFLLDIRLYADDFVVHLHVCAENDHIILALACAVEKIEQWCNKRQILINPEKLWL